ncbi:hypothetical protein N0V88_000339 [Collariella sp. IMI 366227]|nr:hypothetical protein N0V88_000339 [Collariella sp. IMI 366227]
MVNLAWNHFGPIPPTERDAVAFAQTFYLKLKEAFPEYVKDFEQKYTAWTDNWSTPGTVYSPDGLSQLAEYELLAYLGPKTVPLVVHKLSNPTNFMVTGLYNHLETDPSAKISRSDALNFLTLNRQANLIVELNHERFQRAQVRINAWKALFSQQPTSTAITTTPINDPTSTTSEEHTALIQLGPSIVAQIMLEYKKNHQAGPPWYRLLHELVGERPMEVGGEGEDGVVDVQWQWEMWKDWFEKREQ